MTVPPDAHAHADFPAEVSAGLPADFPAAFPADFRGSVLRPGDDRYDAARALYQGRAADTGPALIAQCADEDDVATVLRHACAHGIPVAVRGGGHGSDGYAMPGGALVVDLSAMKAVTVDPQARVVRPSRACCSASWTPPPSSTASPCPPVRSAAPVSPG